CAGPRREEGRPGAGTPGCETEADEQGERALAGRMRYANGCEADQRRDRAGAQSRRRFSAGPAAPDRSSPVAWLSRWPALGLARGGLAAISARDLVDPVAVHLLRAELELEALAHNAGKKAAHGVRLPAGGLHHRAPLERHCPLISGAKGAPRSCPAGCIAEVGLRWCGATPRNRTEDLDVKACKEATDGV